LLVEDEPGDARLIEHGETTFNTDAGTAAVLTLPRATEVTGSRPVRTRPGTESVFIPTL
jgi:hypothetical protein